MEFKDKLKTLRLDRKLSQQALADAIHISRSAIAKWENGLGLPSQDALDSLIAFFGVQADYFDSIEMGSVLDGISSVNEDTGHRWNGMWSLFCNRYTIVSGCLLLLFGLFCFLTQWKFISLPMDGISVKYIYTCSDGRLIYALDNVPEDIWCSEWEFLYTEDGSLYKIPKRSIIELNKEMMCNQLLYDQWIDFNEYNSRNRILGLPEVTKWYLGKPGNAILIYEEGMMISSAPKDLLAKWGLSN